MTKKKKECSKKQTKKVSKNTCGKKSCSKKCNKEKATGCAQKVIGLGKNPVPEYPRLFRYQESLWTKIKRFLFCKL